tara:strand:+ start:114 stop:1244 length:1131 start_codon:yes stop_codon:yes gene_type:complete
MDPKKKFYLFKQANNFCAVPWNHIKVEMDGTITTCVNGKDAIGHLANNSIEEITTGPVINEIRSSLYNDIAHKNCKTCIMYEDDTEYKFLRNLYNPMFQHADVDYADNKLFKLSAIDLHWSSTCNLKCITCWAKQSSAIAQEEGKPILHTPDKQADKIIDLILSRQHDLKEIYLSGGEPTLIKHNIRLLRQLDKSIDCNIRVNTNMMFEQNNPVITELQKFKNVLVTISADAIGPRFEYIRREADWDKFLENLAFLQNTNFNIRLNSVFFIASALHLTDTQQFFYDNYGITDFTINQVKMGHSMIQCRNLPDKVKSLCVEKMNNHKQRFADNSNLVGQLNSCLAELQNPREEPYTDFFESFANKTSVNWRNIFTEL